MDVINQFQLPPALAQLSTITLFLLFTGTLVIGAFVASLSAFIASAPKSGFFRGIAAVITHVMLVIVISVVSININQAPGVEGFIIIGLISAVVAYATCFAAPMLKGIFIALVAGAFYFVLYLTIPYFLQQYSPETYNEAMNIMLSIMTQYRLAY